MLNTVENELLSMLNKIHDAIEEAYKFNYGEEVLKPLHDAKDAIIASLAKC